ncbi:hypothetical protein niasHT_028768 [Heterodera trifolii]|uniref:nucleoside-diphosphate kinase n=1 Tax=Heterodera trifolii TaxID=157864 RepID=A0ABD2KQC4_9BILA
MERTFVCIKPESVRRCLVGKIIERFEAHGFRLIAIKMIISTRKQAADHYIGCSDQPFFPKVISYMTSGPVVAMIWEGVGVVKGIRKILGATPDKVPPPGTLRAEFRNNSDVGKYHDTVCHGSDSAEDAVREFAICVLQDLGRTNNAQEGFHLALRMQFNSVHPPLSKVITVLKKEERITADKLRQYELDPTQGIRIRERKKTYRENDLAIRNLVEGFDAIENPKEDEILAHLRSL